MVLGVGPSDSAYIVMFPGFVVVLEMSPAAGSPGESMSDNGISVGIGGLGLGLWLSDGVGVGGMGGIGVGVGVGGVSGVS
jgi:hypothetical protein